MKKIIHRRGQIARSATLSARAFLIERDDPHRHTSREASAADIEKYMKESEARVAMRLQKGLK